MLRQVGEIIKTVALLTLPIAVLVLGIWFMSTASKQAQLKALSIFALLVATCVTLALLMLVVVWWYASSRWIPFAIGLGLAITFYVWFLVASVFFVIDEFFATKFGRSWMDFKTPPSLREPMAATLGAIFLVASFFPLWVVVKRRDSWAERVDQVKLFLAFFLAGISILATSKILDPLAGTDLDNYLQRHLGNWGQHWDMILLLGAIALASIATLIFPSKKDLSKFVSVKYR